jgi:hypothetical protein
MITKGIAKYVYLDSTEKFNGEDTGKYTLTVSVDDNEAKALEKAGVKVRTIKSYDADGNEDGGTYRARKFSTKYPLSFEMVKTSDGEAIGHDFGAESEVEVLWKAGNEHPQHGVATYLTAVKVSKRTEGYKSSDDETNEFFAT